MRFSFKARAKSFIYAFRGIGFLFKTEHNAWIHLLITIGALIAGWGFHIDKTEWLFIIFAIGSVFSAEALNSAVEKLADRVTTEQDPLIRKAKDMAAGAVLIAAICAAAIGLLIFIPKIMELW